MIDPFDFQPVAESFDGLFNSMVLPVGFEYAEGLYVAIDPFVGVAEVAEVDHPDALSSRAAALREVIAGADPSVLFRLARALHFARRPYTSEVPRTSWLSEVLREGESLAERGATPVSLLGEAAAEIAASLATAPSLHTQLRDVAALAASYCSPLHPDAELLFDLADDSPIPGDETMKHFKSRDEDVYEPVFMSGDSLEDLYEPVFMSGRSHDEIANDLRTAVFAPLIAADLMPPSFGTCLDIGAGQIWCGIYLARLPDRVLFARLFDANDELVEVATLRAAESGFRGEYNRWANPVRVEVVDMLDRPTLTLQEHHEYLANAWVENCLENYAVDEDLMGRITEHFRAGDRGDIVLSLSVARAQHDSLETFLQHLYGQNPRDKG